MDIRQFALPSRQAALDRFATVSFEGNVSTWSFSNRRMLTSFCSCYDFGGTRMALSADSSLLITASFGQGLVEQYTFDGVLAWTVTINQPQRLAWLEAMQRWCVTTESNQSHLLDVEGRKVMSLPDTERIIPLDQQYSLAVHADSLSILDGQLRSVASLVKRGFGVLDAVRYAEDDLAVAFAGGALHRFSIATGRGTHLELPAGLPQTLAGTTSHALYAQIDVPGTNRQLVQLATSGHQFAELLALPWDSGRGLFAENGRYFLSHQTGIWEVARAAQAWGL